MTWEADLLALWDDLEQQAEGLALRQRDAEVAELARAEYSAIDLAGRLESSTGTAVELVVETVGTVRGRLVRMGTGGTGMGWCLVVVDGPAAASRVEWVVNLDFVVSARGLADRVRAAELRPVTARLGLGSVLRRTAESRRPITLARRDGERLSGLLGRVGADFVEIAADSSGPGRRVEIVPLAAVVAVRSV